MSHEQISTPLSKDQAFALVDAVMERDDLALSASAHEDEDTGEWVFEATCEGRPNITGFEDLARQVLGGEIAFTVAPIDAEADWVSHSLAGLKPVTAGGFYVYGSHETDGPPENLIPIRIDAAQAFGTGHHETTTGCLEAIENVLATSTPERPIDLGTGTGILAIAVAKRRDVEIVATDIDPLAVKITRENADANGVGSQIIELEATGTDHPVIRDRAPYDLIIANILAGPLIELAPDIGAIADSGAAVILSGLLTTQADRVIAAYEENGMALQDHITRKEWSTLTLKKA